MASTSSFLSMASCGTNGLPLKANRVGFRPLRVSAVCTSTAERARPGVASLYEVLGIPMGATCKEIKAAYRKLARVVHPDVAINSENQNRGSEFMKIHEAYSTLSDPVKRADYDRMLYGSRWPLISSSFSISASDVTVSSTGSRFSGYTGRTWETDQCW
ncbi:hypothetical protein HS088_TW11G00954 [Tripterygium wilfordii]|uniref:J domain-containing protein n=1 Tax=Tripterygium wilfordii TaxID=458696 RepID=A0A7J7D3E6_TRIWF|nr:chaperone protein dnaJ 11, chloroplastic-like [Tripterygium wilfordii]KAF5740874.1 hypothetical protein HS088_TW11G00954 [Tripterygium wilfordii]